MNPANTAAEILMPQIPTIFQLLSGSAPIPPKCEARVIKKLFDKSDIQSLTRKQGYLEKNAHLPCSKCGKGKRHRSANGKIYSTLCQNCIKANAKKPPKRKGE